MVEWLVLEPRGFWLKDWNRILSLWIVWNIVNRLNSMPKSFFLIASSLAPCVAWDGGEKAAFSKVYTRNHQESPSSVTNSSMDSLNPLWFSCDVLHGISPVTSGTVSNIEATGHHRFDEDSPCHVCQTCEGSAVRWSLSHGRNLSWNHFEMQKHGRWHALAVNAMDAPGCTLMQNYQDILFQVR